MRVYVQPMSIITKIFGDPNEKIIKSLQPVVGEINGLEAKFEKMSDEELRGMTMEFKKKLGIACRESSGELEAVDEILKSKLDEILP